MPDSCIHFVYTKYFIPTDAIIPVRSQYFAVTFAIILSGMNPASSSTGRPAPCKRFRISEIKDSGMAVAIPGEASAWKAAKRL